MEMISRIFNKGDCGSPVFFRPDHRFFIEDGRAVEEKMDFVLRVPGESVHDKTVLAGCIEDICNSDHVDFAFIYGSAINSTLKPVEVEDVDIFIAEHVHEDGSAWDHPPGVDIRHWPLSEIRDLLRVRKRYFRSSFNKAYFILGNIFVNGILAIKPSKALEDLIAQVRRSFGNVHKKALSRMVEYDCKKNIDGLQKRQPLGKDRLSREKGGYLFYGSRHPLTLDEARSEIEEALIRKRIQPRLGPAIARRILKGIKSRHVYEDPVPGLRE